MPFLNFLLLAVVIRLEECFQLTSEDICFHYADPYRDGCRLLIIIEEQKLNDEKLLSYRDDPS